MISEQDLWESVQLYANTLPNHDELSDQALINIADYLTQDRTIEMGHAEIAYAVSVIVATYRIFFKGKNARST